ncbi:hypothetical protein SUGI_0851970 [Cryptomeria japonica]|nr:hypothetical protein SUGI_0851970 [Cryptomeria japonica]
MEIGVQLKCCSNAGEGVCNKFPPPSLWLEDAAMVSHTPPPFTTAATSMPEVLTGDQMSQIDDIMLSTIDFGLQGYMGTPSTSRDRPKKKNSSKMPKCVKKRGRMKYPYLFHQWRTLLCALEKHLRIWYSDSFSIDGEPSSVHWRSISGTDPFATLAPRSADEPSTKLRTASKMLDFDDPPQV